MATQSETVQKGATRPRRMQLIKSFPRLYKTMRKMSPDEPRYVKPPRSYELPEYHKDMQYCRSKELYLRPVRYCDIGDPHVVARAHDLGAYELSDREYAEAAYWWMKNNMWWEMDGWYGAGETLRRGRGTCNHLNNAYAALCRCAGIKARIKLFKMRLPMTGETQVQQQMNVDPVIRLGWEMSGGIIPDSEMEVFVDGEWAPAYIPQTVSMVAATGWPITDFGESCLGLYYDAIPGSIRYQEGFPLKTALAMKVAPKFVPATTERMNLTFQETQLMGQMILDSMGGFDEYNKIARQRAAAMSKEEASLRWFQESVMPMIEKRKGQQW